MKQKTVKADVTLSGVGLHTGQENQVTIKPSEVNTGITFKRMDLEKQPTIKATAEYVFETTRSTSLKRGDAVVRTIEHALAALAGLQIDNAIIEVTGEELPILDGSALPFMEAIKAVGVEELSEDRKFFKVTETVIFKDEATGAEITIVPSDNFEVATLVDYNSPYISSQYASMANIEDFEKEIAPARTFAFLNEVEALFDQGLIKGGSLDNAIVIANESMTEADLERLAKKLNRPSVAIEEGVLNTTALRYSNEPARHKLLDVVGDLMLVGVPIQGKVIATKPGHTANTAIAKVLRKMYQKDRKLGGLPKYDPTIPPVKTTMEIEAMLPHRHPFLLVDKIISMTEKLVVGVKNITYDEYFFSGHFPNNPIMPGVLQIEAMAQTGGILALNTVPDPENWDTYFLRIDNAKFKQKVVPGDTLIIKMELLKPIRRGLTVMKGTAYVGDKIVSEGELTAQIIRRAVD
jgi:UDP-3-O-[3-hydroxymyristoyl] N-acetylglucosamine deacetylase/3-hydroxyacyl-[acyl-carrier-protein] dehydratase